MVLRPVIDMFLRVIQASLRWTPHPVIATIRDNRDYIRVLSYSYYTTGWGILLRHHIGVQVPYGAHRWICCGVLSYEA